MQGRGLKLSRPLRRFGLFVAPRAGAWIETFELPIKNILKKVAPRAGAWIETKECKEQNLLISRPSCRDVD